MSIGRAPLPLSSRSYPGTNNNPSNPRGSAIVFRSSEGWPMLSFVVSLLMFFSPLSQQKNAELRYEVRADASRLFGKGQTSGVNYYDVIVTRQPNAGIPIKLDFTRQNTTFSF